MSFQKVFDDPVVIKFSAIALAFYVVYVSCNTSGNAEELSQYDPGC